MMRNPVFRVVCEWHAGELTNEVGFNSDDSVCAKAATLRLPLSFGCRFTISDQPRMTGATPAGCLQAAKQHPSDSGVEQSNI
jgi:hypothetical protein